MTKSQIKLGMTRLANVIFSIIAVGGIIAAFNGADRETILLLSFYAIVLWVGVQCLSWIIQGFMKQ